MGEYENDRVNRLEREAARAARKAAKAHRLARLNFSTYGDTMPSVAEKLIETSAAKRKADRKAKRR